MAVFLTRRRGAEGGVAGEVGAEHQGVDEEADEGFQLQPGTAGDG